MLVIYIFQEVKTWFSCSNFSNLYFLGCPNLVLFVILNFLRIKILSFLHVFSSVIIEGIRILLFFTQKILERKKYKFDF